MAMRWPETIERIVRSAVESAAAGTPTVLDIAGEAGYGKSSLARWVARHFPPGQVLRVSARENDQADSLAVARQLEPDLPPDDFNRLRVARRLGEVIDERHLSGPVALLIDDLQWSDPESIDALGVLLERMAGDRVLIIAAHRPSGPRHRQWNAVMEAAEALFRITLDGLDQETSLTVVRAEDPSATPEFADALRRHTGGSPLLLRSLLSEYPIASLRAMAERGRLPAPSDLVSMFRAHLSELDPEPVRVLETLAVLGDTGADEFIIAAVAGVDHVDEALAALRAERLVVREEHPVPRARIFHGVVRAAIYETIPLSQRQRLHGRAAARMPSARERLDHRVAAASGMNDGLASDLDAFADELHDARHYRQAAHTRRQAAYLSAAPDARAHRELDADFDAILALDMDDVSTLGDGTGAEPRARFIRGAQLAAERDYSAAADVLATLTDAELSDLDDRAAYRARVIRAWATISCGRSAAQAKEDIRIAETSPDPDRAIQGYLSITRGQAEFVTTAPSGPETIRALTGGERSTLAASPEGLSTLAWRGTSLSFYGLPARQIADLEIVTARLGDGIFDFGDGAFSAFQGFAYFLDGQWGRAAIALDLARVGPRLRPAPLTATLLPIASLMAGDGDTAREELAAARAIRLAEPQSAAVGLGDIVEVLALLLIGTPDERARWFASRTADFGPMDAYAGRHVQLLWKVARAVAASWAGRSDVVADEVRGLREAEVIPWGAQVARWLDARIHDDERFADIVSPISQNGIPDFPLLEALIHLDLARRTSDRRGDEARSRAERSFTAFGGERLLPLLFPDAPEGRAADPVAASLLAPLSDREREIATLLLEGLSYAQIGRELFITRSTVAFHLTRVYAKTNTTSRHELVEAARAERPPAP